MNAYQVLGIESSADERTIKRAYAARIKQYRPDTHPAEFAQVRAAYENVLHWLRENRQWEEQQQLEESLDEPVATEPVESKTLTAETAPESEPEQPAPQIAGNERNFISGQLTQLEEIAIQGNEQAILAKYREQSDLMAIQNLDMQLEYEHALLYWVLATQHPSLLVFAEANKRYDWVSDSIAICRRYGEYAGYRLATLNRLWQQYEDAVKQNNPFIKIKGRPENQSPWISTHLSMRIASQFTINWGRTCDSFGLSNLTGHVGLLMPKPRQIYWVDVFIGLGAAGVAWLLVKEPRGASAWLIVIATQISFTSLPLLLKMAHGWVKARSGNSQKPLDQFVFKLYWAASIVFIIIAIGAKSDWLIVGILALFLPLLVRGVYEFLGDVEEKFLSIGKKLVRLILWTKRAMLALKKRLIGLVTGQESRPVPTQEEPGLEQIKAEFGAGLRVAKVVFLAYAREVPWWGWIVIIWFSFTIVLSLLK
ncbi:MAG: DnaJ domain-containing protein [Sideroxyarcus sp.]|nr:DnaJ domain-containing protein [Sideroxyarcus sp.]